MRVLYLEDDALDAEALQRALRRLRPDVKLSLVASPNAALNAILASITSAPFDLIVVDVNLPEMNGFEFIDRLRAKANGSMPRIVVFTSSEHRFDVAEADRTEADAYVVKTACPRCFDDLVGALDKVNRATPPRPAASLANAPI